MARTKLNDQQTEDLKKMVVAGVAPQDIAEHFQVAISSVHNYKKQLKEQGVEIPDVRGKRPQGNISQVLGTGTAGSAASTLGSGAIGSGTVTPQSSVNQTGPAAETMTFVVNGTNIHVEGHAKDVVIAKDGIKVTF